MRIAAVLAVLCVIAILAEVECRSRRPDRRPQNVTTTPATRSASCPAIECPDQHGICPYGPNQDENLCPLCGCRPSRHCAVRPMCRMACPNGFENGPDGCPICRCYTPSLTPVLLDASSGAAASNRTTSRHRGHHQRNQQQQPSVTQHARFKTANGTDGTPTVGQLPALMSSGGNQTLPERTCPPMCLMYCEHGLKQDSNGCPICECNSAAVRRRSPECTRPMCAMFCENGFRTDSRGCTICQCFEPGTSAGVVASPQQCPRLRCHTSRRCASGFEVDQDSGCRSCICRQSAGA